MRFVTFIVLSCLLAGKATAELPSSGLIIPGKAVGAVRLGMRRAEIIRLYGPPLGTVALSAPYKGIRLSFWVDESGWHGLSVWFRSGRVVQLETDMAGYRTTHAIGPKSEEEAFRARYGTHCVKRYVDGRQGFLGYCLDATSYGITILLGFMKDPRYPDLVTSCGILLIHAPGSQLFPSNEEEFLTAREAQDELKSSFFP